ncbi:DUF429 domain-containing protein [Streptomyces sp. JCM17656]|nr:DUF429 domain-containing protein [Streptomyces sp. JCM17656]
MAGAGLRGGLGRCHELAGGRLSRQAWTLAPKLPEVLACCSPTTGSTRCIPRILPCAGRWCVAGLPQEDRAWPEPAPPAAGCSGLVLPDELGEADRMPVDELLDAAAAAWSAHRIALGVADRFPGAA